MTVVFGSRHFDCRRSRNGEISFRDLSASFAALTPVEMTVFSSLARDDGVLFSRSRRRCSLHSGRDDGGVQFLSFRL